MLKTKNKTNRNKKLKYPGSKKCQISFTGGKARPNPVSQEASIQVSSALKDIG